jgi:hypothetical protein
MIFVEFSISSAFIFAGFLRLGKERSNFLLVRQILFSCHRRFVHCPLFSTTIPQEMSQKPT